MFAYSCKRPSAARWPRTTPSGWLSTLRIRHAAPPMLACSAAAALWRAMMASRPMHVSPWCAISCAGTQQRRGSWCGRSRPVPGPAAMVYVCLRVTVPPCYRCVGPSAPRWWSRGRPAAAGPLPPWTVQRSTSMQTGRICHPSCGGGGRRATPRLQQGCHTTLGRHMQVCKLHNRFPNRAGNMAVVRERTCRLTCPAGRASRP